MICPCCEREWPEDTEQAICIEKFNECIVCRFGGKNYASGSKSGIKDELDQIMEERHRRIPKKF